jgi:hypothetical protein
MSYVTALKIAPLKNCRFESEWGRVLSFALLNHNGIWFYFLIKIRQKVRRDPSVILMDIYIGIIEAIQVLAPSRILTKRLAKEQFVSQMEIISIY